ncbi:MAG: hypothetical protein JWM76_493 [Pseudonocardiales bacterium]|nr:hypothetical protein [Pseudonocardiales bacterium]
MRVLSYGDLALLLEVDDLSGVLALDAALHREPLAGMTDVVPAARTVLIQFEAGTDLAAVRSQLDRLTVGPIELTAVDAVDGVVEIPVVYDGADLDFVASTLDLTRAELIRAHTDTVWTVAFCGFAPGFAYLTGTDERLAAVRRRSSPRTRIPAGAVALAGGFSAVYPGASPGGWQLLGQTELRPFDVERDPPALLQPGMRVRFLDLGAGS